MKTNHVKLKRNYYIIIVALFAVLIMLTSVFFAMFASKSRETIEKQTTVTIEQSLTDQINTTELYFSEKILSIQNVAEELSKFDDVTSAQAFESVSNFSKFNLQDDVGIVDLTGKLKTVSDKEVDISSELFFQNLISTKQYAVSGVRSNSLSAESVCMVCCPIIKDESVVGAVVGIYSQTSITDCINTQLFDGFGYVFISDGENNLVTNDNTEQVNKINNYMVEEGFALNKTLIEYKDEEFKKEYYICYSNFAFTNWKAIVVVSTDIASQYIHSETIYALILILETIVLFVGCAIVVYCLIVHNVNQIRERDWKFKTAMEQISHAYFEYDVKNHEVHFNSGAQEMLGVEKNIKTPYENKEFISKFSNVLGINEIKNAATIKNYPNGIKIANYKTETFYKNGENGKTLYAKVTCLLKDDQMDFAIGTLEDISENKAKLRSLYSKINTDNLTKSFSRDYMVYKINEILKKKPNQVHAFMILDLDAFKQINDSYGHNIGDEVLIKVANAMKYIVNQSDYVGRIGGDEFILFLQNIKSRAIAKEKAKQITDGICSLPVSESIQQNIKGSIGISMYPLDSTSYDDLYRHADLALQEAKKQENLRYSMFGEFDLSAGNDARVEILELEQSNISLDLFQKELVLNASINHDFVKEQFKKALNNDEFQMYVQPKIWLNGKNLSAECLVRWNSPRYGFLMPMRFINLFEKMNVISSLDTKTLEMTIRQLSIWKGTALEKVNLSVNQCVHLVTSMGYAKNVRALLKKYDVSPSRLTIEISERSALSTFRTISKVVSDLRKIGVNFSVDDFGSGFTSLNMLKNLDVNEIKLDRLFFDSDETNEGKSLLIVKHIIKMAHDMNVKVVTEGVETKEQLSVLQEFDCDMIQGFYFDKPMTVAEYVEKYNKK